MSEGDVVDFARNRERSFAEEMLCRSGTNTNTKLLHSNTNTKLLYLLCSEHDIARRRYDEVATPMSISAGQ